MSDAPRQSVSAFIENLAPAGARIADKTIIQEELLLWGDELSDFMISFAKQFEVDMSTYRWQFHTPSEGFSIGGLLFGWLGRRGETRYIPITVEMLRCAATRGRWPVAYPSTCDEKRNWPAFVVDTLVWLALGLAAVGIFVRFIAK